MSEDPNTDVATDAAAAQGNASDELKTTVDSLVTALKQGTADVQSMRDQYQAPVNPTPGPARPAFTPETIKELITEKGAEEGVSEAFVQFAENVILPMKNDSIAAAANMQKSAIKSDPDTGALFKRFEKKITEKVKTEGITNAYIAEHGYAGLLGAVAGSDEGYQKEKAEARATELFESWKSGQQGQGENVNPQSVTPAARPATEGVAAAPGSAIRPLETPNRADAIRAIEMSPEEERFQREQFGMGPHEARVARHEMKQMVDKYGEHGIRRMGGVPITTLKQMGLQGDIPDEQ